MTIRPDIPSIDDLYIAAGGRHITAARNHLHAAICKFDDAGYDHDPTARAYSFVAGIVAEFNGRPWRPVQPLLQQYNHIEEAAKEYRRRAGVSY